jgi:thiol-disulfide isomerase/thioredoxin
VTFDPESGRFDVLVRPERTVSRSEVLRRVLAHGAARDMTYTVRFADNGARGHTAPSGAARADGGHPTRLVEQGVPFALPGLDGRTHSFEPGHGPAVIVFWASWCEPCVAEAPHLARLYRDHGGRLKVLAISIDDAESRNALAQVVHDLDLPYPVLLDPDGAVLARYAGGATIPLTIVLDAAGGVRYHHGNFQPGDERRLETAIREVLEDGR